MNEEEKKAIERFSKAFEYLNVWNKELIVVPEDKKYFLTVLNLLEKKDKMIDEIIGFLATRTWATCPNEDCGANLDCENRCSNDDNIYEECWKMYFERKAENGN